jgi:signal transduction histidine kinase
MKINYLTLFFLIFLPLSSFAQLDSLYQIQNRLQKQPSSFQRDTSLTTIYNSIAWNYRIINADSTLKYGRKALKQAQTIKWQYGEMVAYQSIGVGYRTKSDYPNTVENYLSSLKIAEEIQDSLQIASCYNSLGLVAQWQYKYELALDYFKKTLAIYQSKKNKVGLIGVYNNMGLTFFRQKNYQDAFKNYRQALQLDKTLHNPLWHAITFRNLSEIYLAQDSLNLALKYAQEALLTIEKLNNKTILTSILNIIATLHQKKGDYPQAIQLAQKSIVIGRSLGNRDYVKDAFLILYKSYKQTGQVDSSLLNYETYIAYRDSLLNEENQTKIENLKNTYENDKRKTLEKHQKNFANLYAYSIYAGFIFLASLAILLFINNLQKRKANKLLEIQKNQTAIANEELQTQNEQLNDLNREKDGLMNVVAHDLRAPLNRVKGLVSLVEMQNPNEESQKYLDLIKNTCDRGRRLIQDLLDINQIADTESTIEWDFINLNEFMNDLIVNYQSQAQAKSIQIYEFAPEISPFDLWTDENLLNRVMDNLLSNAVKFSYKHSNIFVKWGQNKDKIFISIKDEGPGIKPEDRKKLFQKFQKLSAKPTAGEDSTGLGLAIVKSLTERLNGNIEVKSEEGRGTEFIIKFPMKTRVENK